MEYCFSKTLFLTPKNIVWLKGDKNYTEIFFANGNKYVSAYTLKKFEEFLSQQIGFIRLHKSYIANLNYLTDVDFESDCIILQQNYQLVFSRRKKKVLSSQLPLFYGHKKR